MRPGEPDESRKRFGNPSERLNLYVPRTGWRIQQILRSAKLSSDAALNYRVTAPESAHCSAHFIKVLQGRFKGLSKWLLLTRTASPMRPVVLGW